jgi:hypothetical protein
MDDELTGTDMSEGSALRKQLETVLAENKELKAQHRVRAFKDAGYDPDSGHGKALAKLYDGTPDPDAIRQFAKDEFGWDPPSASAEVVTPGASPDEWATVASVSTTTAPPSDPSSIDNQIAKAEAEGDWDQFDRLSAVKLEALRS